MGLVSLLLAFALAKQDLYKVLGVERSANAFEVKKAYRKLAIETHPDKNPTDREAAQARFIEVQEAYETLSDPAKRRRYDNRNEYFDGASPYGDFKPPGDAVSSLKDLADILKGVDAWIIHVYADEVNLFGDWMYRLHSVKLGHVHVHKADGSLLERLAVRSGPALLFALEGQVIDLGLVSPYFVETQILQQLSYEDSVAQIDSAAELDQFLSLRAGPGLRFVAVMDRSDDRSLGVFLGARASLGNFAQVGKGLKALLNVKHVPTLVAYDPFTKKHKAVYMPTKPREWVVDQLRAFGLPELSKASVEQRCPKCKKNLLILTFPEEPDEQAGMRFTELCATTRVSCYYLRAAGTDWAQLADNGPAYVLATPDLKRAASISRSSLSSKKELKDWIASMDLEPVELSWPAQKAPAEPAFKLPKEVHQLQKKLQRLMQDEQFPFQCLIGALLIGSVLMPMMTFKGESKIVDEPIETEVREWTVRIEKPPEGSFGIALGATKDDDTHLTVATLRPHSPAGLLGDASLQAADRIVAVDGAKGSVAMRSVLASKHAADFTVQRTVPKKPKLKPGQRQVTVSKSSGGSLGLTLLPVTNGAALLEVAGLKPGSVAGQSGVLPGDRIVAVNGRGGAAQMQRMLVELSSCELTLERGSVAPAAPAAPAPARAPDPLDRFTLKEQRWKQWTVTVTKPPGASLGLSLGASLPEDSYVLVTGVKPDSICGPPEPDMRGGDRIIAVDGQRNVMQMRQLLVSQTSTRLTLERAVMTPPPSPARGGAAPVPEPVEPEPTLPEPELAALLEELERPPPHARERDPAPAPGAGSQLAAPEPSQLVLPEPAQLVAVPKADPTQLVLPEPAQLVAVPKADPTQLVLPVPAQLVAEPKPAQPVCAPAKLARVPKPEVLRGSAKSSSSSDQDASLSSMYETRAMLRSELDRMQAVGGQLSDTSSTLRKTTQEYDRYSLTLNGAAQALQGLKGKIEQDRRYVIGSFAFFCSTCAYIALKRLKLLALGGLLGGWVGELVLLAGTVAEGLLG